jgi:hypothetical protein
MIRTTWPERGTEFDCAINIDEANRKIHTKTVALKITFESPLVDFGQSSDTAGFSDFARNLNPAT